MNPIEKYVRKIAREEAEAVLAASETKLTLKIQGADMEKAVAVRELRKYRGDLSSFIDEQQASG